MHLAAALGLIGALGATFLLWSPSDGSARAHAVALAAPDEDVPPPAPRELRAAWIATVANIDWPSRKGLSTDAARGELRRIIERAAELNLNALILQVRPTGDALYPSRLEPWSEWLTGQEGKAPEPLWDPLAFAIRTAHSNGLELHAWFNPYRARHVHAKSPHAPTHVAATRAVRVVDYGGNEWMDPGDPRAAAHSLRVILDVVERYDIDGVHLDDYFYPYPSGGKPFPDDDTWRQYGRSRGSMTRNDWRRKNVDDFVQRVYAEIKERKPFVRFGISPFGIARPDMPPGIEAGLDQYDDLYADVRKWLRSGWVDYMAPQLYWPIRQKAQAYDTLLHWWVAQNTEGRNLVVGNYASKIVDPDPGKRWPVRELLDQLALTRRQARADGNVWFSMKALLDPSVGFGNALRSGPYETKALPPDHPWLDGEPPGPPQATRCSVVAGTLVVAWHADPEARLRTVYLRRGPGRWEFLTVLPGERTELRLPGAAGVDRVALGAVDMVGNESMRRVLVVK